MSIYEKNIMNGEGSPVELKTKKAVDESILQKN